jgi:glutathione synthase/RimK-type ligase-like ATP-grasp enzyme
MADKDMLKIGLLVGMEWSMPPALITEINARSETTGVIADFVKLGGTEMNAPCEYRVIIDRISHEVPFYRTYLKNAALQGVKVVNDPLMWSSDDKYFGASLIARLGLASPRTVALPNKDYVPGIDHNKSLRNLIFPLDWNALVEAVGGFPCILKDAHGGGWKGVYVVHNMQELWNAYDESGLMTMILQEFIAWDEYARNMCIAQNKVRVMRYDPNKRYYYPEHGFSSAMETRLIEDTLAICQAFGYDMNTCEFAIKDGVPYAIDFMNPAPDMDVNSLGRGHFDWIIQTMADEMIALAQSKAATRDRYDWGKAIKKAAKPKGPVSS